MNTMAILLSDTYKQIHNKIYPKGMYDEIRSELMESIKEN